VIHLAAIVGGRESIEGRPLAVADNLSIDSEFFQWCLKTQPRKIVYFSSSAAYPISLQCDKNIKLREFDVNLKFPGAPDMTYGWSK
jgi:nucleoside-diphosphate-sugar epimerase